jgi:hypothetical protein
MVNKDGEVIEDLLHVLTESAGKQNLFSKLKTKLLGKKK